MDKEIIKRIVIAFHKYADNNPDKIGGISYREGQNRELIRVDMKCKYTKNCMPVFFDFTDETANVNFSFYFTIPYLTLFDEYELTKSLNKGIDYFKASLSIEDERTKVDMNYAFPCVNNQYDIAPILFHLIEDINQLVERFLSIYNEYCDNVMWENYEKQGKDIIILSQYRKKT